MIELIVIRDLVAIFGVIAGFSYYVLTVRATKRNQQQQLETRQLQLYTTVFQPGQSREWLHALIDVLYNQEWEDYDDYRRKYPPESNHESYISMIQVLELFTMIGLYVEQNALNLDLINKHNGKTAVRVWEKVESFVHGHRERTGNPLHWSSFETLYNELKKINP